MSKSHFLKPYNEDIFELSLNHFDLASSTEAN